MGRVIYIQCKSQYFTVIGHLDTQHSANPIHLTIQLKEDASCTVYSSEFKVPDLPELVMHVVIENLVENVAAIVDIFPFVPNTDRCKAEVTAIASSFLESISSAAESIFNLKIHNN